MPYGYSVYFTERPKHRVIRWEPDTGEARVVAGEPADGDPSQKLRDPYGLAIDADGSLLIADKLNHRICRLEGRLLKTVIVRDADNHRADVRYPMARLPLMPTALCIEPKGTLLITYSADNTVYRVHHDGRLELVLGIPPIRPYYFAEPASFVPPSHLKNTPIGMPTAIVRRRNGTVYMIERYWHIVREYHPDRGLRSVFRHESIPAATKDDLPESLPLNTYWPRYATAMALDKDEEMYLADAPRASIWHIDSSKGIIRRVNPDLNPCSRPAAITFGPDGVLWALDIGLGKVTGYRRLRGGRWEQVDALFRTVEDESYCPVSEGAGIVCSR